MMKIRKNYALIFCIFVVGGIILLNLFEFLSWQTWKLGSIFLGSIFILNILWKYLHKKYIAHLIIQFLIFIITLILLIYSLYVYKNPYVLETQDQHLSEFELFSKYTHLRSDSYPNLVTKKLDAELDFGEYTITDEKSQEFHFKMHPSKQDVKNAYITYQATDKKLEISFKPFRHNAHFLDQFFSRKPSLLLGTPYMNLDIDLKVDTNAELEMILNCTYSKIRYNS